MKVANSYASLLRGVSQQVDHERAEGQHTEQVNMLSDPVKGLTRRHGTVWQAEQEIAMSEEYAAVVADTANWGSIEWTTGGKDYVVLYRKATAISTTIKPLMVYCKTDKVFLNYVRNVGDADLTVLENTGISAITPVGRYLYLCCNTLPITGYSTAVWNTPSNLGKAVIWVRGGAYGRTYTVKVRLQNGTLKTASYTTPLSSYQGTLDTSGIPATATDYTKQVNDMVNDYNSAVTAWIGTAAAAIQPHNIALALAGVLIMPGIEGFFVSHTLEGSTIGFNSAEVKSIEVDDGGDGTLMRGVADEIESADKVSTLHFHGKVVKVRNKNSEEAFYLRAVAKDTVATGLTEVTWVEGASTIHEITGGFFNAGIVGNNFYVASTAPLLSSIMGITAPPITASTVGDDNTNPKPFFVGRTVSYLGTFQNRLLVGSGGTLAVSQTDDYLNFFRSTVLTTPASDAFEMLPQGSEDDQLVHGILYDQNLVIFGKRRQYLISGTQALTPTSANMPVMSNYADVVNAAPIAAGGLIFYAKDGDSSASLHQIQPGQNFNSPESFPASSQLTNYLRGSVSAMASLPGSPSTTFVRTSGYRNGLYVFAYVDRQDGRKMDSWSRWEFSERVGSTIGIAADKDAMLIFTVRISGGGLYVVADRAKLLSDTSDLPYLDSIRPYMTVLAGTTSWTADNYDLVAAYAQPNERRFKGASTSPVPFANLISAYGAYDLMIGAEFASSVTLTNPFMRDGKDNAILSGRLTITRLIAAFKESGGFSWVISYRGLTETTGSFNGRILGDPDNIIGIDPISTGQHTIPIGREARSYAITLSARNWQPLTITTIEWGGQFFNRVQRF